MNYLDLMGRPNDMSAKDAYNELMFLYKIPSNYPRCFSCGLSARGIVCYAINEIPSMFDRWATATDDDMLLPMIQTVEIPWCGDTSYCRDRILEHWHTLL